MSNEDITTIARETDETLAKLEWVAQQLKSQPGDEFLKEYKSELMVIIKGGDHG